VHLKVADLSRSISFYELLGMTVRNQIDGAAFLAFGGYHHHLALNSWHTEGSKPAPQDMTGLFHFAIRYSSRQNLARTLRKVTAAGVTIDSSSDCGGIADSIYLRDPDENGVELTWDRPRELRPVPLPADDSPLDLEELLHEAD